MDYLYVKSLHIIFVITWFSGMFYQCRLFIYNREAQDKPEPEKSILKNQFDIMISRLLFGICWPSTILTLIFGTWMLSFYPEIPTWLWIKIGMVLCLFAYQFSLHQLYRQQKSGVFSYTGNQLRMWNEVPTVFLVAIVMLVVVKQNISLVYGLGGLVAFVFLLMSAIRIYKSLREKKA
jgi:putative membrane protein